jgi:surfactin synthase thioesterase subunit
VITDEQAWLRTFTPAPGAPRLYCIPHAGGSASSYLALSRALAPRVEVVALQYPGRLDRFAEPPVESITGLADIIAKIIEQGHGGRTAVLGHSMGALVAFEISRRVNGLEHLFVSGAVPSPYYSLGEGFTRNGDAGPDDDTLLAEIRGYGGTQAEVLADESMLELILPPLRADYRALVRYRPEEARVAVPVTVLIGKSDPRTAPELAARWQEKTTAGPIEQHAFPGGHFYLHDHPREIAEIVAKTLGR